MSGEDARVAELMYSRLTRLCAMFACQGRKYRANVRLFRCACGPSIACARGWIRLRESCALAAVGCHKKSVTRKLKQGDSVGLIIGGIEEVLEGTFDDKDVLYLKNRKGFIKIAMDHGSGVVPCFCFGENSLFMVCAY